MPARPAALSALALEPGRHTLRFINATGESGEFMGGDQSVTLEGRAGELLFVHLAEAAVEEGGRSLVPGPTWSVSWKVDVLPSVPPVLLDRPLVLHNNGSWLVMPEPALLPGPSGGPAQN